jgi:hypothetical protein
MRTVFIEKSEVTGEFFSSNNYSSWNGFHLLGYHCEFFVNKQIELLLINKKLTKETIVHGNINSVAKALMMLNVSEPMDISIPTELLEFTGRKIWETTLGDIRQNDLRCFIKPLEGHKIFTGHVRDDKICNLVQTSHLTNDFKVLASEVVNFITEYRGFVLNGELIGWKNYCGDFTKMPDTNIVKKAISKYKSSPCAYSIDFGLDDKGRSLLVEVNDAFSLGSYGLDSIKYAKMIEARWDEMVNFKD